MPFAFNGQFQPTLRVAKYHGEKHMKSRNDKTQSTTFRGRFTWLTPTRRRGASSLAEQQQAIAEESPKQPKLFHPDGWKSDSQLAGGGRFL
jgi:hypothetical protein